MRLARVAPYALVAGLLLALTTALPAAPRASGRASDPQEVVLASGRLAHHRLTNELFHLDKLWFRVTPKTDLHRWLLGGVEGWTVVLLTPNPERFGDSSNVRIMTGKLIHGLMPTRKPMVHTLHISDPETLAPGPIAFETTDLTLMARYSVYDDAIVSLVIQLIEVD